MNTDIQNLENLFLEQAIKISELNNQLRKTEYEWESACQTLLLDFLKVVDTFEQAEMIIEEKRWNENEVADKAIKRLVTAKKKALSVLEKHGVTPMSFANNLANDDDCKIIDIECDRDYPDNYILRTEKKGYLLSKEKEGMPFSENLRLAEVVIVKN